MRRLPRYTGLLLINGLAGLVAFLLEPGSEAWTFVLFTGAISITAWYWGRLAGFLAVAFATWILHVLLADTQGVVQPEDLARLSSFALVTLVVSSINSARGSERKAAERRASAEARRNWIQELLGTLPTGIVLADGAGEAIVYANEAARELVGIFPPSTGAWGNSANGDAAVPSELASQIQKWLIGAGEGDLIEDRCLQFRRAGETCTVLLNARFLQARFGQPAAVVGTFSDITELVRTQEALRESLAEQQRLLGEALAAGRQLRHQYDLMEAVVSSVGEGLCALDLDGTVFMANPVAAELLRFPIQELLGANFDALVHRHPLSPFPHPCPISLAGETGPAAGVADEFFRSDGTRFPVRWTCAAVETSGKPVGLVLVFSDETASKQEEAARALLSEQRSQMVATASHALRAPISAMLANLEVLEGVLGSDLAEVQQGCLSRAIRSTVQLADIVEDLLTISRLQRGHVQPRLEPVEIGTLLREVAEDWRARAEAAEIKLCLEVPSSLPAVETDPKQLKHVVLELLENAFKYGKKRVRVRSGLAGDHLRISVEDDGPGLRPEERDHLFEPFFRGVDAYREQLPGTGLGLSIAQREADLMGATLSAANGPDGGAAFSLLLPMPAESQN